MNEENQSYSLATSMLKYYLVICWEILKSLAFENSRLPPKFLRP